MGFYDNKNDFTPIQDANVPFTNTEGALDWDSVIEKDSSDFVLLPVGQYDFTIVNLEKNSTRAVKRWDHARKRISRFALLSQKVKNRLM